MSDHQAIQDVISTYSQYASQGDWDTVLPLFTDDAVWDIPHLGVHLDGKPAIAATLVQFRGAMAYVLQLNSPALIRITGDTARATSGIREGGKLVDREETFEFLGQYDDTLVRTAGGWKFTRRVFRLFGEHNAPALPPGLG